MTDTSKTSPPAATWWKRIGLLVAIAWVAFFGYLLLTADPPDLWFEDIAVVDGPGHAAGGFITGSGVFLFLARRRRPVVLALVVALVFLIGLELIQDLFTDRGYERSDVALSVVGAAAGVAAGRVGVAVADRLRARNQRRRKRP